MPAQTPTKNGRVARERVPEVVERDGQGSLRALAIERLYRVRRFKLHLVTFAVGIPLLAGLWVLTEYFEEHS